MAAPTLLDYATSDWTDSSTTVETTDDLDWSAAGDVIVVLGATEDNGLAMATPTGTGITLAALSGLPTNSANSTKVYGWSATAAGDGNTVLTSTNGASGARGIAAWAYTGSTGLGTPVTNVGTGITVSVTVAQDSSVVMVLADWSASADVTVDTVPAGGTIRQAHQVSGLATFLVVEWSAQAAGTRSYGVANWAGTGTVSKAAVEVKGTAGASPSATEATGTGAAGTGTAALGINASEAAGTADAQAPTAAAGGNAAEAAAAGTAQNAAVTTSGGAAATEATATGTADNAVASVSVLAGIATAAGSADNATAGAPPTTESLFTTETPATGDNSDGTPGITVGTSFRVGVPGNVTGGRFYATTTVSGTYTVALWQVTAADPGGSGTLLASKTVGAAPTAGAWNTVSFDSPVAVATGVLYQVGVFSSDGRYVATTNFFGSDLVTGDLTADANGDDPVGLGNQANGKYTINASLSYPATASGGTGTNYFADVLFAPTGAVTVTAGLATGTGSADNAANALEVLPAEAPAIGTAIAAVASVAAAAVEASGAAAANNPSASTSSSASPNATEATATGSSANATAAVTVLAGVAAATGEAFFDTGSSISLDLIADNPVESVGTAYNATVSTASATNANATEAVGSGAAQPPTPGLGILAAEGAGAGSASGPALAITGSPAEAGGTGAAYNATVTTSSSAVAPATEAVGSGQALDIAAATTVNAGTAAAVGAAQDPTASTVAATSPDAALTAAAGTAYGAAIDMQAPAGTAVGAGTAFNPGVLTGADGQVLAGTATATGEACNPRVRKRTPRPYTGTVHRPFAGVTLRP